MRNGIYYLNKSGSRWIALVNGKREKIAMQLDNSKTIVRTVNYYSCSYGIANISYGGKKIDVFLDEVLPAIYDIKKIKRILSNWHRGRYSATYSFLSTGKFHVPYSLRYLLEILENLEYPNQPKCNINELNYLYNIFCDMIISNLKN